MVRAWWRKADEIILAFPRDLPRALPDIAVDGARGAEFEILRPGPGEFSRYTSYYIENGEICFELDPLAFDAGALSDLDYYVCGSFNGWGDAIKNPEWKMKSRSGGRGRELKVPIE